MFQLKIMTLVMFFQANYPLILVQKDVTIKFVFKQVLEFYTLKIRFLIL